MGRRKEKAGRVTVIGISPDSPHLSSSVMAPTRRPDSALRSQAFPERGEAGPPFGIAGAVFRLRRDLGDGPAVLGDDDGLPALRRGDHCEKFWFASRTLISRMAGGSSWFYVAT